MGAGAINPFFNVRQSRPISQFVDESMPAELMLQAGLARQGQYDKGLQLANMLGAFDQAAIPNSGDELYVKELRDEFNNFIDSNINKDLSNNQIQTEMFKHIRKIQQDPQLKNVRSNVAAYQQLMEDAAELYKKGKRFDPSFNRSLREVQRYASSGEKGGRIGQLGVSEALNLEDKRQSYFKPLHAEGREGYGKLKEFGDLYFKFGKEAISKSRIGQQVRAAVADYENSSEGRQDIEIYQDMVESGQVPRDIAGRPITNEQDYLLDRLTRTGTAFQYEKTSQDYAASLNKDLGRTEESPDNIYSFRGGSKSTGITLKELTQKRIENTELLRTAITKRNALIKASKERPLTFSEQAELTDLRNEISVLSTKRNNYNTAQENIENKSGFKFPTTISETTNTSAPVTDLMKEAIRKGFTYEQYLEKAEGEEKAWLLSKDRKKTEEVLIGPDAGVLNMSTGSEFKTAYNNLASTYSNVTEDVTLGETSYDIMSGTPGTELNNYTKALSTSFLEHNIEFLTDQGELISNEDLQEKLVEGDKVSIDMTKQQIGGKPGYALSIIDKEGKTKETYFGTLPHESTADLVQIASNTKKIAQGKTSAKNKELIDWADYTIGNTLKGATSGITIGEQVADMDVSQWNAGTSGNLDTPLGNIKITQLDTEGTNLTAVVVTPKGEEIPLNENIDVYKSIDDIVAEINRLKLDYDVEFLKKQQTQLDYLSQ